MPLRKIKDLISGLNESSVDFPHEKPSEDVWARDAEGVYILRMDVKNKIIKALRAYPDYDLMGLAKDIYIIGSITSNIYDDESDIDIHIIPNTDKIEGEDNLEFTKKVMKWYKDNRVERNWFAGTHPFEVFVEFDEESDLNSIGVYSLFENDWIKEPELKSSTYNPYEIFKDIFNHIEDLTEDADVSIGELRRDLIDYKYIRSILKRVPEEVKVNLKNLLQEKLEQMELEIEALMKDKEHWKDARRKYSAANPKWEAENARYKMLQRFLYGRLVSDLEDLIEDHDLDDEDIPEVERALQKFMTF